MINTKEFSLDEIEKGVMISFPTPANLKVKDQYILYFDAPIILPDNAGTTIQFQPSSGSYSIIGSSFVPKILVTIKSLYRLQIKTLVRLIIKDTNNNIIYTDYMMLVCSPESVTSVNGKLLAAMIGNNHLGPNGGSIIQITESNELTSTIVVGDRVEGPGVLASDNAYVQEILNPTSFELNKAIVPRFDRVGTFTFTKTIGCVDPSTISNTLSSILYTVLDVTNNWTYKVRNQIIAKFICDDPENNQDLTIFLPIKNTALLATEDIAPPIPAVSRIKVGGRVVNDTIPISDI